MIGAMSSGSNDDVADTEPTVWVSAELLQSTLPILDAFTELFGWGVTGLPAYTRAVEELAPIVDAINERCAYQGLRLAHVNHEAEFMHETVMWAIEVAGALRDALTAAGHDGVFRPD